MEESICQRPHIKELIYNIPNIQGKYNRMVIPRVHSKNNNIIKLSVK